MGMRDRCDILGDDGKSAPEHWDPVWNKKAERVDIWLSINGQNTDAIEQRYKEIEKIIADSNGGVIQLAGHRGKNGSDNLLYQDAATLFDAQGESTGKEHFGYTDGISNPFFEGTLTKPAYVLGARYWGFRNLFRFVPMT